MKDLKSFINQLRRDFASRSLDEKDITHDPLSLFEQWMTEAVKAEVAEPNAMVLSTVSKEGIPSARIVLLRDYSPAGFVFFTNYKSQKGKNLETNPNATVLFFWPDLERQIRITGKIRKASDKVSDDYFHSRPRESQIGAWTSEQSEEISSRDVIESRYSELVKQFEGKDISRPSHWGGYVLEAAEFEFWQGRPSRLHDRISYKAGMDGWKIARLSP